MDAQIVSDVRDRALGLKRQANPSLDQLLWVLPRSWHDRRLSSPADESTKRSLRTRINDLLLEVLPDVNVHTLGGSDICDLLDDHPNLRRAFPQVLSLRDLDDLLRSEERRIG